MHNKSYKVKYYRYATQGSALSGAISYAAGAPAPGTFFDKIQIQSLPGNGGNVAVGDAPVATAGSESGIILQAGQIEELEYVNLADLKFVSTSGTDAIMIGVYTVKTTAQ